MVERSVTMGEASELNRTRGKTRGEWGECFFFLRQFFARALLSDPLEEAKIT